MKNTSFKLATWVEANGWLVLKGDTPAPVIKGNDVYTPDAPVTIRPAADWDKLKDKLKPGMMIHPTEAPSK